MVVESIAAGGRVAFRTSRQAMAVCCLYLKGIVLHDCLMGDRDRGEDTSRE